MRWSAIELHDPGAWRPRSDRVYRGVAAEEAELVASGRGSTMTLLVISPDYASHLLPLATLATAWRDAGERVVVATGPSTGPIVESVRLRARATCRSAAGRNPGVIRADEQPDEEADSLRGFFDATRLGMVPTLRYQASERLTDLMWDPVAAGRAHARGRRGRASRMPSSSITSRSAPGSRCRPPASDYADVVLGHPSALPVARRGVRISARSGPPPSPRTAAELADLRRLCAEVSPRFTAEWNRAARALDPGAAPDSRRLRRARRPRALQLPGGHWLRATDASCLGMPSSARRGGSSPSTTRSRSG